MANKKSDGINQVPATFLACRDKGHHWIHQTDKVTLGSRRRATEVTRWWECKGCGCQQEEVIRLPSCQITGRRYIYPDGYLVTRPEGGEPIRVSDVRREVFTRSGIKF